MENVSIIRNHGDYSSLINNHNKVIIFYTSNYCPACKDIKSLYIRIANRYNKYITFAYADVEECEIFIETLPTFESFIGAKSYGRITGDNVSTLKSLIKDLYKSN